MFGRVFTLFVIVPFIEVAILLKMASVIGFWETVSIQVGTAFIGATLAKLEGLRVWTKIQNQLNQGLMPTEDMVDGLMIFGGGIVLLTPGLLTDFLGIFLLVPFTRKVFKRWIQKKFDRMRATGQTGFRTIMIE